MRKAMLKNDNSFCEDLAVFAKQICTAHLKDKVEAAVLDGIIDNMVFELVASIEEEYGGQFVYVRLNSPTRKLRIYKDFTGDNYRELSKKYKISLNQIRKIINEERKRKNRKFPVQGSFL